MRCSTFLLEMEKKCDVGNKRLEVREIEQKSLAFLRSPSDTFLLERETRSTFDLREVRCERLEVRIERLEVGKMTIKKDFYIQKPSYHSSSEGFFLIF